VAKAEEIKYSGSTEPELDKETKAVIKEAEKFSGTISYNMPETVDEAIQMWGEAVVLNKAQASVIIDLQRIARSADGDSNKAQELADAFKPGVTRRGEGGDSNKSLIAKISKLTPDQLAALLAAAGVQK
jgi:hypothetical protein